MIEQNENPAQTRNAPVLSPSTVREALKMMRFYFHLKSKTQKIPDTDGKQLPSLCAAQQHAVKMIHNIVSHVGDDNAENWRVHVTDDQSANELHIPFSYVSRQRMIA